MKRSWRVSFFFVVMSLLLYTLIRTESLTQLTIWFGEALVGTIGLVFTAMYQIVFLSVTAVELLIVVVAYFMVFKSLQMFGRLVGKIFRSDKRRGEFLPLDWHGLDKTKRSWARLMADMLQ